MATVRLPPDFKDFLKFWKPPPIPPRASNANRLPAPGIVIVACLAKNLGSLSQ